MDLLAFSATVLGIASAEQVSLAPCVTNAKMDIMALIRQAACPASATTGLIVVMFSQVLVSTVRKIAKGITVKNAKRDFFRVLMLLKNAASALVQK